MSSRKIDDSCLSDDKNYAQRILSDHYIFENEKVAKVFSFDVRAYSIKPKKKLVLYCYILFILPIDSFIFQKFNMYSYIEAKRIY